MTHETDLLAICARAARLTVEDLVGPCRRAPVVRARHEAMWLLRHRGLSYAAIGELMGGRDPKTARYGCLQAKRRAEIPPLLEGECSRRGDDGCCGEGRLALMAGS